MRLANSAVAIAAGVLGALPAGAVARTIDTGGARGDYAVASASGTITHPRVIKVIVRASPRQRVLVSWSMVCSKGGGAGSKDGQFRARTRVRRTLRMPYRDPRDCSAAANAQLDQGGRLRIKLVGR
jgi:hypothetical protein